MRKKHQISYLAGILNLSLAVTTSLYAGTALSTDWTQKHIKDVPNIMMHEPYFDLFGQHKAKNDVDFVYEEAVKLVGHSCGATSSAWEMTKKALEILYPVETPVRGNIMVYAPGAEDEWNIGVVGEVITYITGSSPATGFNGAEFGNGFTHPGTGESYPGDQVYNRQNKMVYTDEHVGTPPNFMTWKFERIDTGAQACLRFNYAGPAGIQPGGSPAWVLLGAKLASGEATAEEAEAYINWWNVRTEYVFENADSLVVVEACD